MTRFVLVRDLTEQPLPCGLYRSEYEALSLYNWEKARGIAHDDEWRMCMAALQHRFDEPSVYRVVES